jgi:hypothetical protein
LRNLSYTQGRIYHKHVINALTSLGHYGFSSLSADKQNKFTINQSIHIERRSNFRVGRLGFEVLACLVTKGGSLAYMILGSPSVKWGRYVRVGQSDY